MRAADHHPDLVHDRNGPAAEIGEAARILVETSTRCRVGLVIGKKHPANAEIIVKRNEIDSLVERVHALDVEADTEPVRGSGILDIGGGADEAIFVAMAGNPPAKRREHVEMIDHEPLANADLEREDIDRTRVG